MMQMNGDVAKIEKCYIEPILVPLGFIENFFELQTKLIFLNF